MTKHDAVTNNRRFNAILAAASINEAIEYYNLFKEAQENCIKTAGSEFAPLNIACVFSPPAEGNKDIQQIQEDLPQEKEDNKKEPDKKKQALMGISKTISLQRQIFQVICTSPRPTRILSISASTTVSLSSMSILSQSFIYPLMVSMFRFPYISADI